jgi:hypothetical protein
VASVSVGDLDVGETLVRAGAAWHYVQYTSSEALGFSPAQVLAAAEREARQARRGLWQSASPQPPWTFRAQSRPPTAPAPAAGEAAFHGNRESKVFHAPGCQHYNCKNCTVPFATVGQATAAGFRAHAQCVRGK